MICPISQQNREQREQIITYSHRLVPTIQYEYMTGNYNAVMKSKRSNMMLFHRNLRRYIIPYYNEWTLMLSQTPTTPAQTILNSKGSTNDFRRVAGDLSARLG